MGRRIRTSEWMTFYHSESLFKGESPCAVTHASWLGLWPDSHFVYVDITDEVKSATAHVNHPPGNTFWIMSLMVPVADLLEQVDWDPGAAEEIGGMIDIDELRQLDDEFICVGELVIDGNLLPDANPDPDRRTGRQGYSHAEAHVVSKAIQLIMSDKGKLSEVGASTQVYDFATGTISKMLGRKAIDSVVEEFSSSIDEWAKSQEGG